eukprot:g6268.t1
MLWWSPDRDKNDSSWQGGEQERGGDGEDPGKNFYSAGNTRHDNFARVEQFFFSTRFYCLSPCVNLSPHVPSGVDFAEHDAPYPGNGDFDHDRKCFYFCKRGTQLGLLPKIQLPTLSPALGAGLNGNTMTSSQMKNRNKHDRNNSKQAEKEFARRAVAGNKRNRSRSPISAPRIGGNNFNLIPTPPAAQPPGGNFGIPAASGAAPALGFVTPPPPVRPLMGSTAHPWGVDSAHSHASIGGRAVQVPHNTMMHPNYMMARQHHMMSWQNAAEAANSSMWGTGAHAEAAARQQAGNINNYSQHYSAHNLQQRHDGTGMVMPRERMNLPGGPSNGRSFHRSSFVPQPPLPKPLRNVDEDEDAARAEAEGLNPFAPAFHARGPPGVHPHPPPPPANYYMLPQQLQGRVIGTGDPPHSSQQMRHLHLQKQMEMQRLAQEQFDQLNSLNLQHQVEAPAAAYSHLHFHNPGQHGLAGSAQQHHNYDSRLLTQMQMHDPYGYAAAYYALAMQQYNLEPSVDQQQYLQTNQHQHWNNVSSPAEQEVLSMENYQVALDDVLRGMNYVSANDWNCEATKTKSGATTSQHSHNSSLPWYYRPEDPSVLQELPCVSDELMGDCPPADAGGKVGNYKAKAAGAGGGAGGNGILIRGNRRVYTYPSPNLMHLEDASASRVAQLSFVAKTEVLKSNNMVSLAHFRKDPRDWRRILSHVWLTNLQKILFAPMLPRSALHQYLQPLGIARSTCHDGDGRESLTGPAQLVRNVTNNSRSNTNSLVSSQSMNHYYGGLGGRHHHEEFEEEVPAAIMDPELRISRMQAVLQALAVGTLQALERGAYPLDDGRVVQLSPAHALSREALSDGKGNPVQVRVYPPRKQGRGWDTRARASARSPSYRNNGRQSHRFYHDERADSYRHGYLNGSSGSSDTRPLHFADVMLDFHGRFDVSNSEAYDVGWLTPEKEHLLQSMLHAGAGDDGYGHRMTSMNSIKETMSTSMNVNRPPAAMGAFGGDRDSFSRRAVVRSHADGSYDAEWLRSESVRIRMERQNQMQRMQNPLYQNSAARNTSAMMEDIVGNMQDQMLVQGRHERDNAKDASMSQRIVHRGGLSASVASQTSMLESVGGPAASFHCAPSVFSYGASEPGAQRIGHPGPGPHQQHHGPSPRTRRFVRKTDQTGTIEPGDRDGSIPPSSAPFFKNLVANSNPALLARQGPFRRNEDRDDDICDQHTEDHFYRDAKSTNTRFDSALSSDEHQYNAERDQHRFRDENHQGRGVGVGGGGQAAYYDNDMNRFIERPPSVVIRDDELDLHMPSPRRSRSRSGSPTALQRPARIADPALNHSRHGAPDLREGNMTHVEAGPHRMSSGTQTNWAGNMHHDMHAYLENDKHRGQNEKSPTRSQQTQTGAGPGGIIRAERSRSGTYDLPVANLFNFGHAPSRYAASQLTASRNDKHPHDRRSDLSEQLHLEKLYSADPMFLNHKTATGLLQAYEKVVKTAKANRFHEKVRSLRPVLKVACKNACDVLMEQHYSREEDNITFEEQYVTRRARSANHRNNKMHSTTTSHDDEKWDRYASRDLIVQEVPASVRRQVLYSGEEDHELRKMVAGRTPRTIIVQVYPRGDFENQPPAGRFLEKQMDNEERHTPRRFNHADSDDHGGYRYDLHHETNKMNPTSGRGQHQQNGVHHEVDVEHDSTTRDENLRNVMRTASSMGRAGGSASMFGVTAYGKDAGRMMMRPTGSHQSEDESTPHPLQTLRGFNLLDRGAMKGNFLDREQPHLLVREQRMAEEAARQFYHDQRFMQYHVLEERNFLKQNFANPYKLLLELMLQEENLLPDKFDSLREFLRSREYVEWQNFNALVSAITGGPERDPANFAQQHDDGEQKMLTHNVHLSPTTMGRPRSGREWGSKLLSAHTDAMVFRTNFVLAKEKLMRQLAGLTNGGHQHGANFHTGCSTSTFGFDASSSLYLLQNLCVLRGPVVFGAPFLPVPIPFDLLTNCSTKYRSPRVHEDPHNKTLRFADPEQKSEFQEMLDRIFDAIEAEGDEDELDPRMPGTGMWPLDDVIEMVAERNLNRELELTLTSECWNPYEAKCLKRWARHHWA